MKNGKEVVLYVGGEKLTSVPHEMIVPNKLNNNSLERFKKLTKNKNHTLTISRKNFLNFFDFTPPNKYEGWVEYYYRRKNKYFFRNDSGILTIWYDNQEETLKELKRGEFYHVTFESYETKTKTQKAIN